MQYWTPVSVEPREKFCPGTWHFFLHIFLNGNWEQSTEWMHGRKVGLLSQMRCLLLNYAHGLNRPAGLVGRGHGRCTGGRGADPHTPSAAGKCCWPGYRRPHPPRSFFPQILQTVKSIQWWQWYSSVNNNKKKSKRNCLRQSIYNSNRVLSGLVGFFLLLLFHGTAASALNRLFANTAETHFTVRSCCRWGAYEQERA